MSSYLKALGGMYRGISSDLISEEEYRKYKKEEASKPKHDYGKQADYWRGQLDKFSKYEAVKKMPALLPLNESNAKKERSKTAKESGKAQEFYDLSRMLNDPEGALNNPNSDLMYEEPIVNLNNLKTYMKMKEIYPDAEGDDDYLEQKHYQRKMYQPDMLELNKYRKYVPEERRYEQKPGILGVG